MNKMLIVTIMLSSFIISCASTNRTLLYTPRYTHINPTTDFSEIKTLAFSSYDTGDDPLALRDKITHELIGLGFNVIDTEISRDIPDVFVKFNYVHSYTRSIKRFGRAIYYIDNFTISFVDSMDGDIILTSTYPKLVHVNYANKVVQMLFVDIDYAIKAHEQQQ